MCDVIRARTNAAYVACKNREEEQKALGFTLPCAGIIRTGSKGLLSPTRTLAGRTPSVGRKVRRKGAPSNGSVTNLYVNEE